MNVKVLIQTITELPEAELLTELTDHFVKEGKILLPDLKKLYAMAAAVFTSKDRQAVKCGRTLIEIMCKQLLAIEIEQAWSVCGSAMVESLGFEDAQVRKCTRSAIMSMLKKTNNPFVFLDALSKVGLENHSSLVAAKSTRMICRVLEYDVNLLTKKANVPVVKLCLEKLIDFSKDPLPLLKDYGKTSLIKIYTIGVKNLEEVILRMDSHYREELELLWEKQKNEVVEQRQQQYLPQEVRFEQLPLIKNKVFGVFEPIVIERLIKQLAVDHHGKNTTETEELYGYDVRKSTIMEFRLQYEMNFDRLLQYLLPLYRLLVRMLYQDTLLEDVVDMVVRLFTIFSLKNRVNIEDAIWGMVRLLNSEKVSIRKKIRAALSSLRNSEADRLFSIYQASLDQVASEPMWFEAYEIMDLLEEMLGEVEQRHPPALDDLFRSMVFYLSSSIERLKNKTLAAVTAFVHFHPSYKELLYETVPKDIVGIVEDRIEQRNVRGFGNKPAAPIV
jgi:hypothetical protein